MHRVDFLVVPAVVGILATAGPSQTPGSFSAFGAGCPPPTGSLSAEFYEMFGGSAPDLANLDIELTPMGSFGYRVQQCASSCFASSFGTRVFLGDDQVVAQPLLFAFPHPGGSTNAIGFCSNGYLWLNGTNFNADYTPSVSEFLTEDPRLAPLWTDLNPGAGGQTFTSLSATSAVFTWSNVPEFGGGSNLNTFQVQLFPDGRVVMSFRNLRVAFHSVLVGYSRGGAVPDPGPTDISASMPFTTGNGTRPPALAAVGGNPTIGRPFAMEVSLQPANSVAGFLVLGGTRLAHPLAQIGMPSCTQYTSLDTSLFFAPTPPSTTIGQAIPNSQALVGVVVYAQAALWSPGANPLGVATSNGGQITVGN